MNRRLRTATATVGGRPVLVSAPELQHTGYLGFDVLMSVAMAKQADAGLYFARPAGAAADDDGGASVFELEYPDVPTVRPSVLSAARLRGRLVTSDVRYRLREWRAAAARQCRVEVHRELGHYVGAPATPSDCRDLVRMLRLRLRDADLAHARAYAERPGYLRRALLRSPVQSRLRAAAAADAQRQAMAAGIDPAARLIAIHARESGTALARGTEGEFLEKRRDDRLRNARIETYFDACDELVAQGYTVVRLGDASMTPVRRPGVVDLATSAARTDLLQLYCLLRSELLIAGESGLAALSYLTNTPRLVVNATEPFLAYSVRAPGLFLPKRVVDRRTGLPLGVAEQLGEEYHRRHRDGRRYQYHDNTPAEILDATREMMAWLAGTWRESAEQRRYHDAIAAAAAALRPLSAYLRALGLDEGFLGDGRIANVAVQ
jgi:putative glycosyltransferase (TIGR04372 family)